MFILISVFTLSASTLLSTLSGKDLQISSDCMSSKHPCVPESLNCSPKFYSTSFSLQKSIKELLTMIDPDYSSSQGTFKTFPGIQSGALIVKTSNIYANDETPDLARYNCIYNGKNYGWCAYIQNTNQYFQVGSSIPFVYERLKMSGRQAINQFISSFSISYTLDGVTWLPYNNDQIFIGNSGSYEPIEIILQPFIARAVKILPKTWVNAIAGKFEFYIFHAFFCKVIKCRKYS